MGSSSIYGRGVTVARKVGLKTLVGAGDKIMIALMPLLVPSVALNVWRPEWFAVGGPPAGLAAVAWAFLAVGVAIWLSSVALILTKVPRGQLITTGPFALLKHPLYTAIALLVLPAGGLLLNTWLGVFLGMVMYLASRRYAPAEERILAEEFGPQWDAYAGRVKLPWL